MVKRIIVLFLFTMILNGCKSSDEKIGGRYYAKHNKGIEYVDIKADGTYLHYFKNNNIEYKQDGKWKYERDGLSLRFIMYDWITYIEPFEEKFNPDGEISTANVKCDGETIEFWDLYEYNFHRENK